MSMTREQMLGYMENPALLNDKTLAELREILDEFPYFQTAWLLYTRNLLNEKNFRFENQLKICAIHATDRKVLYHLLNPVQTKDASVENASVNIQEVKETLPPEPVPVQPLSQKDSLSNLNFDQLESSYLLEGSEAEPDTSLGQLVKDINETAGKCLKERKPESDEQLIDRFLKEHPTISADRSGSVENMDSDQDEEDLSNENDEFITETLARIYIKQGLYQKAINAFQKLTLKYPEKSVYFARQIEEVTKLLNK